MVLMSFASARCQPLSVKRLMWAAKSEVTADAFQRASSCLQHVWMSSTCTAVSA